MNIKNLLKTTIACGTFACFALQGCTHTPVVPKGEICSIQTDTTVLLKPEVKESPSCHVGVGLSYLRPVSPKDVMSPLINQTLQRIAFGTDYVNMTPEEAVDSMRNHYSINYRNEMLTYYEADLKKGTTAEEMPPWYNHEYTVSTELKIARDSIYNFAVTNYLFAGGAHPNTFMKWSNINANTGKELKKADVFTEGSDSLIIRLISKELLAETNRRLETDTITSLQDLWDNGVLLNIDLYVPDNFLLTDEGVKFLYNRYDIAPYVMGDFQLNIPYKEIKDYLIIK